VFKEYIVDRSSKAIALGFTVLSILVHCLEYQMQRTYVYIYKTEDTEVPAANKYELY